MAMISANLSTYERRSHPIEINAIISVGDYLFECKLRLIK